MTILCDITHLHISTMAKMRPEKIYSLLDHGLITVKFSHLDHGLVTRGSPSLEIPVVIVSC